MMGYEQLGYGQQQFQPQGFFGGSLGGIGGGIGGMFGGGQSGGPLQFGGDAGGMGGGIGGGIQGQQMTSQFLQQHPVLQAVLQHPILAQQFLQWLHQILQQRLMQQMLQFQQQPQGWSSGQAGQFAQPAGQAFGGWPGFQGGGAFGSLNQPGQMQPFGADPYSAWQQQQALAAQYRGMRQFQPGQLMGLGFPGASQPAQAGGQTLH
jgi:hypothetical protein